MTQPRIDIPVTTADRLLAARLAKATANADALQLSAVLHDIHEAERDGGMHMVNAVLPVMLALSATVCTLAQALDGDQWLASLDALVLDLTRAVEDTA